VADTTTTSTDPATSVRRRSRVWRVGAALASSTGVFGLIGVGILPISYALPLIGLLLALGAQPDETAASRPVDRSSRNVVIAVIMLVALAVVAVQNRLLATLVDLFGISGYGLVVTLLAVTVLAAPLAMSEARTPVDEMPAGRAVLTRRSIVLAATCLVTVAFWYATIGMSFMVLAGLVLGLPVALAVSRLRRGGRGRVELGLWRHPMRPALRPHRLQALNVVLCCALLGATMLPGTYDIVRGFLPAAGYPSFQVAFVAGLVALCLLVTVPLARVYLATNLLVLAGSVFLAAQLVQTYGPATDPVTVASPLEEEWYVAQGGHAELVNYHHVTSTQSNALDIVQVVDGQTHRPGSKDLESYYIYGAPILAPADGVVSSVVDGLRDQPIGTVDDQRDAGNQVVIRVGEDRYIMIGHVRAGSIRVSVGDRVAAGQVIAEVGNSGNTDEPHVHIQAQNLPSLDDDAEDPVEVVRALRTYPLVFDDVVLTRDGSESTPSVADPRRGDLVRPAR
jgi:hypothetical protein